MLALCGWSLKLHSKIVMAYCIAACAAMLPQRPAFSDSSNQQAEAGVGAGTLTSQRQALSRRGFTYGLNYTADVLGNPTGGERQSAHYDGLVELWADINFESLAGWRGLTFHVNAFQIHGTSITADNIGSFVSVSNIEAFPSTRLDELWFEQNLLSDLISIRFGEMAIDTEFLIAENAAVFIASTFGWTTLTSDNLPYGGPIYPFAAPGVRLALEPNDDLKLMVGVYNSDPIGPCPENRDPGQCNPHGLEFRLGDPPLLVAETEYRYGDRSSLPGAIKLGGWYQFDEVHHQELQLVKEGRRHDGNYAAYAVFDQMVYRPAGGAEGPGVSLFMRAVVSPADRNQIHAYADAGVVFTGLFPRRPYDVFGIAVAYTGLSDEAIHLHSSNASCFFQNCEALLEVTYAAEIMPHWTMQPVVQYVLHPGGGSTDEADGQDIPSALVVGMRTNLSF